MTAERFPHREAEGIVIIDQKNAAFGHLETTIMHQRLPRMGGAVKKRAPHRAQRRAQNTPRAGSARLRLSESLNAFDRSARPASPPHPRPPFERSSAGAAQLELHAAHAPRARGSRRASPRGDDLYRDRAPYPRPRALSSQKAQKASSAYPRSGQDHHHRRRSRRSRQDLRRGSVHSSPPRAQRRPRSA